ncbi:chaperone Ric-8A-like isoform X2 [Clavelina lepadiformis]
MSRDRHVVLKCMNNSAFLNILFKFGKFGDVNQESDDKYDQQSELNASRCISNVIYLTRDSQGYCNDSKLLKNIVLKVASHKVKSYEQNVLSLRIMLLASIMSSDGRRQLIEDFDARKITLDFLKHLLKNNIDQSDKIVSESSLSVNATNMCIEISKVLFNLNMDMRRKSLYNQEELSELECAVALCAAVLMSKSDDISLTESLHYNAGNAIYSVPPACFKVDKLIPLKAEEKSSTGKLTPERKNFKAIASLLDILQHRVMSNTIATDILHPLLALLSQLCRLSRDIRLYFKNKILPPRKDFNHRPEEGSELRNKLIELFTHNDTNLKHAAADFLFVLCKENVDRFVKYTGYGNAAGLLAARGFLAGGRGDTEYSDTDSDSDTEEYKQVCDEINPVTGHIPPKQVNPLEGMTDEQKEYLAVQLANEISKLSSSDIIQPMSVGDDGKLIPLQQKVHQTTLKEEHSDSNDEF